MADNITFQTTVATPPSGVVVATDDVTSVHFQKVKLDVGGDGVSAPLSNANPVPISDAGGSLTVDGTVALSSLPGTTLAGQTAVTIDYDTGAGTQNIPMVGMALPASGGSVAGGTFTNPIRTDPTGTTAQPVTDGGGSLTVDGSVSLAAAIPAGTNNIGDVDVLSLPSIPAGTNNIGDVDVLTLPSIPAGSNNIGDVDVLSTPKSSTSSTAAQTGQGTTEAQVLASNANRKSLMIQNTGTTVLKFTLGTNTVTQTVYHFALAASTGADDGTGGVYTSDMWTGAVRAISSSAGGTMVITELT